MAYVRVYSQADALQTHTDQLRKQEQVLRDMAQTDVLICRAHLAAFFWQLDHVFESLGDAITLGQKEQPTKSYFWSAEKQLKDIEQMAVPQEINAYRNKGHQITAIIGCKWDEGGQFLHHFLPTILGYEEKESIEMNAQLQQYFEFVANVWLSFIPAKLRDRFPRSFKFPVTVPNTYRGTLPPELEQVPQLEVHIEAHMNMRTLLGLEVPQSAG
jgi:hypothetical protein